MRFTRWHPLKRICRAGATRTEFFERVPASKMREAVKPVFSLVLVMFLRRRFRAYSLAPSQKKCFEFERVPASRSE